ncbi:hypothetical protein Btru_040176 [Bulinus truncatus]|nr:hypothetical protein Btru_040176 [Bulinus truncatus]
MLRMETNPSLRPSGPGSISDDDLEDLFHLDFSTDIYRQLPSSNLDILAEELDIYNGSNASDPSTHMGLTTVLNTDQSSPCPGTEKGQERTPIAGRDYSYPSEALGLATTSNANPSLSYLTDSMEIATTSNSNSRLSYLIDTMGIAPTSNASCSSSYSSETLGLGNKSNNILAPSYSSLEKVTESRNSSLLPVGLDLQEISNPGSSFSDSSLDSELSETSNTNDGHRLSYSSFNIMTPKTSSTFGSLSPYPSVDVESSSLSNALPSLPYSSVNSALIKTSHEIPSTSSLLRSSYTPNPFDSGQNLLDINYTTSGEHKNLVQNWDPHLAGVLDEDEEVFSNSLGALNLLNPGSLSTLPSAMLNNHGKEMFGTFKSEIINVSMFRAKVVDNETVFFKKAPDIFDRFTIRVDNRLMEQIGVIKRDHSSALAYIMDNNLASVEGKVHYNADCIFRIPVEINLSGEPSKKAEVLRHFKRYGIPIIPHYDSPSISQMPGHESPIPFDYDYDHVISSRTFVTPAEMENQLDEMFKTLDEGDKVTEAKAALAVKTPLYPHQKQALNWMICKENNDLLPPFWEQRGTLYLNTLTRKKTAEKPKSIYGGILADDMGLGKTLEMISLIVTNFVNGKPLAEPLPGFFRESFVKSGKTAPVRVKSENDNRGSPESGSNSFISSSPAPRLNLPGKYQPNSLGSVSSDCQKFLNNMNKEMEETEVSPSTLEMASSSSSSPFSSRGLKRSNCDATDDDSTESIFGQGKGKGVGKKSKYHDRNMWESGTDRRPDETSDFVDLTLHGTDKQPILTDSSSGLNISNGFTSYYSAARLEPNGCQFLEASNSASFSNTMDNVIDVDALPESNTYEDITPVDSPDVIEVNEGSQGFKFNIMSSNLFRNHQDYNTRPSAPKFDGFASSSLCKKSDTIVISDSEDELPDIIQPVNLKKETISIEDDLPDIIHPLDLTKRKNIGFTEMKRSEMKYFRTEPDLIDEITPWKKRVVTSSTDHVTGRTITDGPRGTLIICPLSVISNWVEQFDEHVDRSVKILLHVYYGPKRTTDVAFLLEQDVIITTYATLSSDFKKGYSSPLHQIEWLRIVLDEGHTIRNPAAQQTKAIFELQAERKWILSGTPIQNSLKDLWSLINFLQVKPFTEKKTWNRIIAGPLVKRERQALKRVAHLVRNLAMRRTKNQQLNGKPIVSLPARHVYLETVSLSKEERGYYDAMQTNGRDIIGSYYRKGTLLNNYGTVLTILLRLRQLCCHPQLVAMAASKKNPEAVFQDIVGEDPKQPDEHKEKLIKQLKSVLESGSDEECSICLESLKEPEASCPMCRAPLDKKELYGVQDGTDDANGADYDQFHFNPNEYYSSSKVDALMKSLNQLRQEDPRIKSVVVSQFTSLLTLLETPLKEQSFHFARLDGTMRANDRAQAVRNFSDLSPESPTIFLLSLKAGGVGINLTAASRVFLLDPAWNPAAEEQCFDRCHRLGQTKDVVITKFVIEDSVEKRMLELQEKKRQLINGVLDKKLSADQRRKIRIDEIKTLFNI